MSTSIIYAYASNAYRAVQPCAEDRAVRGARVQPRLRGVDGHAEQRARELHRAQQLPRRQVPDLPCHGRVSEGVCRDVTMARAQLSPIDIVMSREGII